MDCVAAAGDVFSGLPHSSSRADAGKLRRTKSVLDFRSVPQHASFKGRIQATSEGQLRTTLSTTFLANRTLYTGQRQHFLMTKRDLAVIAQSSDTNGSAKLTVEEIESLQSLKAALAAAEERANQAEQEKLIALQAAAEAEARAHVYQQQTVVATQEAMAEVESAKAVFAAEFEKLTQEKTLIEEELSATKEDAIDLAVKVEQMASMAVHESTAHAAAEAKLMIAEAKTEAVSAAQQVEERIRQAADEAAAAVILEAKSTIEDALAAAEMAKEQARSAEKALKDRMSVLDELVQAEAEVIQAQDVIATLEGKLRQAQMECHQLKTEVKAAIARAEAAESRVGSNEYALQEMQAAHEKASKDREEATRKALETLKNAAAAREEAAMLAYKAETDSLRAAVDSAQKAEKVKERAMQRRFDALESSLTAMENTAKAWKQRALAVEDMLKRVKEKGLDVLRVEGALDGLLNGGRMDVMLGDPKLKRLVLAQGPRRERPEWLRRKSTAGIELPPLKLEEDVDEVVKADIPLDLPAPDVVWSIVEHQVTDDVFTREAETNIAEKLAIEKQRETLERALHIERVEEKKPVRRVRTPEDLEDKIESGTGNGREIVLQGFNWESCRRRWYQEIAPKASDMAACGITTVWLPPPTQSVAPQGYMPVDLYNLNSAYGSMDELKACIEELHAHDIQVLGDVVLNHRCASKQSPEGIWNIFGGKMAWGPEAIVRDDPNFHGKGNPSTGDIFHAAPNIDHSQEFVRHDIKAWLKWLREEVGYDGWRLDFAKGFWGGYVKEYIEASIPTFSIGEYWDSLAYEGGTVCYNQDAHRQRIINWINATGGTSSAFDVTTKGILHQALHGEYWRLIDPQGKPPGVMGWWPSRAVTFLENHDTGSTQGHWPFPREKLMQGYAYILTHPGTPVVFYDHFYEFGIHDQIAELIKARTSCGVHCRSNVKIIMAIAEGYVAKVGDNLIVKLGGLDWNPSKQNDLVGSWERIVDFGGDYQVWKGRG